MDIHSHIHWFAKSDHNSSCRPINDFCTASPTEMEARCSRAAWSASSANASRSSSANNASRFALQGQPLSVHHAGLREKKRERDAPMFVDALLPKCLDGVFVHDRELVNRHGPHA